MNDPREPHFNALKRILRYVQGTIDHVLHLYPSTSMRLITCTDADWDDYPDTRRSTSGYCCFHGDNLISWPSKCQPTLSHSSTETEYRGVANVVADSCWLRNLLLELYCPLHQARPLLCIVIMSMLYMYLSSNLVQHESTKHVEMDIHYIQEKGCVRSSTGSPSSL